MSRRHQTKNTDTNEKDIVSALRKIPGVTVETDHDDIFVGFRRQNYWFEIKDPSKVNKKGEPYDKSSETAKKQQKLKDTWRGQYDIVSRLDQILKIIGVIK